MDVSTLSSSLDIVAPACGQTLSVDQKVAVETSLAVLKADNRFDKVVFWGRISGIQCDYLIAQGYNLPYAMIEATANPAVSFYSTNGITWLKMDPVDPEIVALCDSLTKPFTGDASTVSTLLARVGPEEAGATEVEEDGEPAPEGYTKVNVTEAMRLAVSVASIDFATAVVPKGYMIMDANEAVVVNRSFAGLDAKDAENPAAYCHFRPVADPKTIVKLGDAQSPSADIFETLEEDVPSGCWSFKLSGAGTAVVLNNLLWPGSVAYAALGGASCGYCYFGTGLKNQDIAFML